MEKYSEILKSNFDFLGGEHFGIKIKQDKNAIVLKSDELNSEAVIKKEKDIFIAIRYGSSKYFTVMTELATDRTFSKDFKIIRVFDYIVSNENKIVYSSEVGFTTSKSSL